MNDKKTSIEQILEHPIEKKRKRKRNSTMDISYVESDFDKNDGNYTPSQKKKEKRKKKKNSRNNKKEKIGDKKGIIL